MIHFLGAVEVASGVPLQMGSHNWRGLLHRRFHYYRGRLHREHVVCVPFPIMMLLDAFPSSWHVAFDYAETGECACVHVVQNNERKDGREDKTKSMVEAEQTSQRALDRLDFFLPEAFTFGVSTPLRLLMLVLNKTHTLGRTHSHTTSFVHRPTHAHRPTRVRCRKSWKTSRTPHKQIMMEHIRANHTTCDAPRKT